MKKVAFMFVAAMAMSFAACTGNKPAAETETIDETLDEPVEVVEEVADSLAGDSVQAEVEAVEAEVVEAQ